MSEPATNAEIEDVLSSIRRLVAQDIRPRADAGTHPSEGAREDAGRLVLTPALRVDEEPAEHEFTEEDTDAKSILSGAEPDHDFGEYEDDGAYAAPPAAALTPAAEHTAPDPDHYAAPDLEQRIAELEAAISEAPDAEWEPDEGDQSYATEDTARQWDEDAESDLATDDFEIREDLGAARQVAAEEGPVAEAEMLTDVEEDHGAQLIDLPMMAGAETSEESYDDEAASEPLGSAAWDDAETDTGAWQEAEENAASEPEPVTEAEATAWDTSDAAAAEEAVTSDPEQLSEQSDWVETPEHDAFDDLSAAVAADDYDEGTQDLTAEPMGQEDTATDATDVEAVVTEAALAEALPPVTSERADDMPVDDDSLSALSDVIAEPEITDSQETGEFIQEDAAGFDLGELDETIIDEEALRDLVADIVRQELQGALGERITRNVRKLVRREIHRALASQELD